MTVLYQNTSTLSSFNLSYVELTLPANKLQLFYLNFFISIEMSYQDH
jgi:hypothetical protein